VIGKNAAAAERSPSVRTVSKPVVSEQLIDLCDGKITQGAAVEPNRPMRRRGTICARNDRVCKIQGRAVLPAGCSDTLHSFDGGHNRSGWGKRAQRSETFLHLLLHQLHLLLHLLHLLLQREHCGFCDLQPIHHICCAGHRAATGRTCGNSLRSSHSPVFCTGASQTLSKTREDPRNTEVDCIASGWLEEGVDRGAD